MDSLDLIVGVHFAAGTLWLAGATSAGAFRDDRKDRIVLADAALSPERALSETEEDLEGLFLRLHPLALALLKAGDGQNKPAASMSRRRGWLEATIMIAAHRASIEFVSVTHDAIAKKIGLRPADPKFHKTVASLLPGSPPPKWDCRAPAFAAALTAKAARSDG